MSNNRMTFIRGHVDALRDLCGDMREDSPQVKAVDLLKSKVDEASETRDTGAFYKAGYEVTRSVASWINLMLKSASDADRRDAAREGHKTRKAVAKPRGSRRKGSAA